MKYFKKYKVELSEYDYECSCIQYTYYGMGEAFTSVSFWKNKQKHNNKNFAQIAFDCFNEIVYAEFWLNGSKFSYYNKKTWRKYTKLIAFQ